MSEVSTWGEPEKRERILEQLREEVTASGLLRCKAKRIAGITEFDTGTVGKYLSQFATEDAADGVDVSVFHDGERATIYEIEAVDDEQRLVTDGGAREEIISNWLIINWREGTTRTRKSKPDASKLGTHELVTSLTLNVTIPEVDVPELVADVEVPRPRVEASELSDLEAGDSPDWMDVADAVVDDNPEADPFDEVDRLVVSVLEDAPDRPDVAEVKRYLQNQLRQAHRGEQA